MKNTVLDGEYLSNISLFLSFDLIFSKNTDYRYNNLLQRHRQMRKVIKNIKDDPKQSKNLYFERKDIVKEMTNKLMDFLESLGVGEKFFRERKAVDLDPSFQTYSGYD